METVKKKWFWGIFISILSIFAMSHNANAINLNFENYSIRDSFTTTALSCNVNLSIDITGSAFCRFPAQTTQLLLKRIQTTNTYRLYKGEIVEFYYVIYNNANWSTDGIIFLNDVQNISTDIITLNYDLIDDFNSIDYSVATNNLPGENVGFVSDFDSKNRIAKVYKITQYVKADGFYYLGFGTTSNSINRFVTQWYQLENSTLTFSLRNFTVYKPEESKENKEVEEKTQDAVDDSQTAGGSSSSDAQTGTTGLLNAITGAVNVITAARPSNCKINGNMGNLDMGQLDLCANPAPAFVQTIGSLILILMCVPLAISLFNRFIAIFRSFQS